MYTTHCHLSYIGIAIGNFPDTDVGFRVIAQPQKLLMQLILDFSDGLKAVS